MASDAARSRQLLGRPHPVPDIDRAWSEVGLRLHLAARGEPPQCGRVSTSDRRMPRRVHRVRLVGTTGTVVVTGTVVAGVAAAATLTIVFTPTNVAPLPISQGDVQAVASVLGINGTGLWSQHSTGRTISGSTTTSGAGASGGATRSWAFGTIDMATLPKPVQETSLGAAEAAAGMATTLPKAATLPSGVDGSPSFVAERGGTVTVSFDAAAGALSGSTLTIHVGQGILAVFGSSVFSAMGGTSGTSIVHRSSAANAANGATTAATATSATKGGTVSSHSKGSGVPSLVIASMVRPTATSTGATTAQLESFVLSQPGFPKDLAREIRLLGNLQTVLPVPVPPGVTESTTHVGGAPAVLLSAAGQAASAVVWEDQTGTIRTVGGLLNTTDTLDVARQLG